MITHRKTVDFKIIFLAMLHITLMLSADVVAYRFCQLGNLTVSGATILFPITYSLSDAITEVYGAIVARKMILLSLISQIIFAALIAMVLNLPPASFFENAGEYNLVLGSNTRFVLSGTFAVLSSAFLNIFILAKSKIFMKGKHFWIRSILSTAISELVLISFTVLLAFSGAVQPISLYKLLASIYTLEMLYAFVFVIPTTILVWYLKSEEQITESHLPHFNPFSAYS